MYYYIFETVKTKNDKRLQDRIKRLVAEFGITGEMVLPSPARTIEELVDIGLTKGYTTIVGIGSDLFLNRIASTILNNKNADDSRIALGYIPKNVEESLLAKQLAILSVDDAINALRFRRLKMIPLGVVAPNKFFLSPLHINVSHLAQINVTMPGFQATSKATHVVITPQIGISWEDASEKNSYVNKIFRLFSNKEEPQVLKTFLSGPSLELKTTPSLPVYLEGEIIAKTPLRAKALKECLRIIINRDTIPPVGKEQTLDTTS